MRVKIGDIVWLMNAQDVPTVRCEYLGKTEQNLVACRRVEDGVIIIRPAHWFTKLEGK